MKIKLFAAVAFISIISLLAYSALAQEKENKGKGQKQEKVGKVKGNNGQSQGNKGRGEMQEKDKDNYNGNRGNGKDKEDKEIKIKDNNGKGNNNGVFSNGNDDNSNGNGNNNGFRWTRENFKDRDKLRKGEKVTICHKPDRDNEPGVSIRVSSHALQAHLKHGDVKGECPLAPNKNYSNDYLKRRTDFYNVIQTNEEQSLYSKSILDYAMERLALSRSQLATLQSRNAPADEIESKRAAVGELEENASLLQVLLQEGSRLLVNRL